MRFTSFHVTGDDRMVSDHDKHPERYGSTPVEELRLRWFEVAKSKALFAVLEQDGLARIDREEDVYANASDTFGDAYTPEFNPDIPPAVLAKQKKRELARINRNGIWDYVLTVMDKEVETIGGFVGKDFYGSVYDTDFYGTAIDMVKELYPNYVGDLELVLVPSEYGVIQ